MEPAIVEQINLVERLARETKQVDARLKEVVWSANRMYERALLDLNSTGFFNFEDALRAAAMEQCLEDTRYTAIFNEAKELEAQRDDLAVRLESARWELLGNIADCSWIPEDLLTDLMKEARSN